MVKTLSIDGTPAIVAHVRRSSRLRRMSLRVSSLDGRVTLSMPRSAPLQEGEAFLKERSDWLRNAVAEQPRLTTVDLGAMVPYSGRDFAVALSKGRRARLTSETFEVVSGRPVGPQVAGLLKKAAREALNEACARYGAAAGRLPARISLRDPRSRWGSCTSAGNLMFSWRLAMAPREVMDYVAAHEVAHLREMNHSRRFWAIVKELCPGFEGHRGWLRSHGPSLHRYSFDAPAC